MRWFWAIGIGLFAIGLLLAAISIPHIANPLFKLLTSGQVITPPDIAHITFSPLLSLFFTLSGPLTVVAGLIITEKDEPNA